MNETQNEAISLIFTTGHVGNREVYNAFTGKDYAQRNSRNADPANVTSENFDILAGVARHVQRAYLTEGLEAHYDRDLRRMFAAYDKYDLKSFKAAADSLVTKIAKK